MRGMWLFRTTRIRRDTMLTTGIVVFPNGIPEKTSAKTYAS